MRLRREIIARFESVGPLDGSPAVPHVGAIAFESARCFSRHDTFVVFPIGWYLLGSGLRRHVLRAAPERTANVC
jgi:hypothetical protein